MQDRVTIKFIAPTLPNKGEIPIGASLKDTWDHCQELEKLIINNNQTMENKEFKFIANGACVNNNKSMKRNKTTTITLDIERAFFPDVIGIEAFEDGTHFEVTIKPKYLVDVDPDQTNL